MLTPSLSEIFRVSFWCVGSWFARELFVLDAVVGPSSLSIAHVSSKELTKKF